MDKDEKFWHVLKWIGWGIVAAGTLIANVAANNQNHIVLSNAACKHLDEMEKRIREEEP